jgi:hypothetical protein
MTETNGFSQGQDVSNTSAPVAITSAPIETSTPSISTEEKVFKQQEVNEIVGRAKHDAVERYKRSADVNAQKPQTSQPLHQQHLEHITSEDSIRRMAAEEAQRLRDTWVQEAQRTAHEQEAQRITNDFLTKLEAGKGKYEDYDQVLGDFEFGAIPHVIQLATLVDNTADVMYDLAKNPTKIGSLQQLLQISPKLAYSEMQRLSKSLKDNENVGNMRQANPPLSQMKPSNTGTDNGRMSVSDYRKKYKV